MGDTKIEWATKVWNPVSGCTKVSEGCRNCYAERYAKRFWRDRKFTDVQFHEDRLDQPLHWKKPQRIFVNSMSDLFHPDVPIKIIAAVWSRMLYANHHTYIVLTKRPDRMSEIVPQLFAEWPSGKPTIFENIWLGVSVENQKTADERIPLLLDTPALVRFVSYEPALGPVEFERGRFWLTIPGPHLDWVIMGGESGPNARAMHPDWARSVRDQCQAAGVPFFFEQWGEWMPVEIGTGWRIKRSYPRREIMWIDAGTTSLNVGKKLAGRLLDGREWDEFPGGTK